MNFENQGVIKRLADQYGPENLTVVLGNGEANGVEVFAETVTQGDPSYAGPLAGVALKIPVYHVLEEEVLGQVPEKLREEFIKKIPLGRFGTCAEVAEMIVFLAGAGAGYITGQVFNVNGGLYM